MKSVEGIYKDGKVKLLEKPGDIKESKVVIVFIDGQNRIDLREHGIDESHAANLRTRLNAFAEDWDSREMDAYDAL